MINLKKESPEVYYTNQKRILLNKKALNFIKNKAKLSPRKIVRLCIHKSKKEKIHEMLIIFPKNYYCPPHYHPTEESFLILKGQADIVIFKKNGKLKNIIKMGDLNSGKIFFQKFEKNTIHLLIVRSKFLYFQEVKKGPFSKKGMKKPYWCPKNLEDEKEFFKSLNLRLKKIKYNSSLILKK